MQAAENPSGSGAAPPPYPSEAQDVLCFFSPPRRFRARLWTKGVLSECIECRSLKLHGPVKAIIRHDSSCLPRLVSPCSSRSRRLMFWQLARHFLDIC